MNLEHRWWHVLQVEPAVTGRSLYHYEHLAYHHGTRQGAIEAGVGSGKHDFRSEIRVEPLSLHYILQERIRLFAALEELEQIQRAMEGEGN